MSQIVNYQKLYAIVCGAASDALDCLPRKPETACARLVLEQALARTEELYLADGESSASDET